MKKGSHPRGEPFFVTTRSDRSCHRGFLRAPERRLSVSVASESVSAVAPDYLDPQREHSMRLWVITCHHLPYRIAGAVARNADRLMSLSINLVGRSRESFSLYVSENSAAGRGRHLRKGGSEPLHFLRALVDHIGERPVLTDQVLVPEHSLGVHG